MRARGRSGREVERGVRARGRGVREIAREREGRDAGERGGEILKWLFVKKKRLAFLHTEYGDNK